MLAPIRLVAIVRGVPDSLTRCELTHLERAPIDLERARLQHQRYVDRLRVLGVEVVELPADEALPDGCFVEDTAIVLDELAVLAMPGAVSRRAELPAIERALARQRLELRRIALPGTLDGGDVLLVGRRLFVGLTTRTNAQGIEALARHVEPHGYSVTAVRVPGCLHLKSAATAVDDHTVIANRAWLEGEPFGAFEVIDVDRAEPGGANLLRVAGELWGHPGYPRTLDRLRSAGHPVVEMDVSEFVKAEAALTCKSLLFRRS